MHRQLSEALHMGGELTKSAPSACITSSCDVRWRAMISAGYSQKLLDLSLDFCKLFFL